VPGDGDTEIPTVDDPGRHNPASRLRSAWPAFAGVAVYCLLGAAIYGVGATASGRVLPNCACTDTAQGLWFLAWPAFALRHGLNPLFSSWVNYPHGINLMDATSSPALGILAAPLTWLLGPVAALNLLFRLAFAASASAMFLVLRRFTTWWPAAFLGGLLYGFSPYMVGQGFAHIFVLFVPIPPLFLLLVHELWERRRWPASLTGAALGVLAAVQLLISPEVLTACGLLAVPALLALGWHHRRDGSTYWRSLGAGAAGTVGAFAVLAGYPLWFYFRGPQHLVGLQHNPALYTLYHQDLLGPVVPTSVQLLHPGFLAAASRAVTGLNYLEDQSYLGGALVVLVIVVTVRHRRSGIVAVSALVGACSLLLSFGPSLYVDGHDTGIPLPYRLINGRPVVGGLLDARFSLYVAGAASVILAVGLDRLRSTRAIRRRSIGCAALGLAVLLPLLPARAYPQTPIPAPAFLTTASDVSAIPAGSVVLPYPLTLAPAHSAARIDVRSLLWQAVAGMRFRIIGVYGPVPGPGGADATRTQRRLAPTALEDLALWGLYGTRSALRAPRPDAGEIRLIRTFLVRYRVDTILVDPTVGAHPDTVVTFLTRALGRAPRHLGGTDVWFGVQATLDGAP